MADLNEIVTFLDGELRISKFTDSSNNGLQVQNSGSVKKICCGVDASMEMFEAAARGGANMIVCHHGLSWADSLKHITDLNYKRLSYLIKHDIALYACHLPLDAHPRYGNNALICKALGLRRLRGFGNYHGTVIGFQGELPRPMAYKDFKKLVVKTIGRELLTMDFGKKTIRTVAVVSGGAGALLDDAGREGLDVFLSGEPSLQAYNNAQEYGINAMFAGHYATEVFGVRALAGLLKKRFRIEAEFVDLGIRY
jgi:dinuclear metal center YbgI/SA1388 family protein